MNLIQKAKKIFTAIKTENDSGMRPASQQSLIHYVARSINMLDRDSVSRERFPDPHSTDFVKYIDTEAILYIREIQEVGVPFPSWREMVTVGGQTDLRQFLSVGYGCYEMVRNNFPSEAQPQSKVLDFGVGCCRTARFFYRDSAKYMFYGCDVDRKAIDYINSSVSFITGHVSRNNPPLPYLNNFFDIVYSISVFTHLDWNSFAAWIKEVHRVINKGGTLILSLHCEVAFSIIKSSRARRDLICIAEDEFDKKVDLFKNDGFVWLRQPAGSDCINSDQYGISFIAQRRFEAFIEPFFNIVKFNPGEIGGWQDLVVLKKK